LIGVNLRPFDNNYDEADLKLKKRDKHKVPIAARIAEERFRLKLSRKGKYYVVDAPKPNLRPSISGVPIEAPTTLSIYEVLNESTTYQETIRYLDKLESNLGRHKCLLDYRNLERLSACGMLLLYAIMDYANRGQNIASNLIWPDIPLVGKQLRRLKIPVFAAGFRANIVIDPRKSVQIATGYNNDPFDSIMDFIRDRIFADNPDPEAEAVYARAVSETINNVARHAYPQSKVEDQNWWLIIQVLNKTLYLAIYDRGVGIPATVMKKDWLNLGIMKQFPDRYLSILEEMERERSILTSVLPNYVNDAELIYLSMHGDVTSQTSPKHGQGSKSIRALVESTTNGKLWIYSNNGLCLFSSKNISPRLITLPKKFPGTLIQWNISLP